MAEISELSSILSRAFADLSIEVKAEETGDVISFKDGVASVSGLAKVFSGELIEFSSGALGIALNLEEDFVGVVVLSGVDKVKEGDSAKRTGKLEQFQLERNFWVELLTHLVTLLTVLAILKLRNIT